ncbi:DMT family transporter [Agreia sp. COWG]|uniref:DMT family transporter n=1 Tax=Agreia sp. COWG TaxID=2773266 RepID=UPI001927491A|nr:EamA family transporter [Agreia sp. COWG]CAD6011323.1 Multidrug transporter [Agreia sp. COWG]
MVPILAVLLAAVCFATTGTAQALAGVDASALSVGAARILVGGGILGVIALVGSARRRRGEGHGRRAAASGRRTVGGLPTWAIIAIGAAGVLAYQPAFFAGTRLNGVAIGTVVALGSAPIFTGVLNAVIRRRLPTRRWVVATGVSLVGVVLVSGVVTGSSPAGSGAIEASGILASLGAGASYALYAIASKLLLDRGWGPAGAMGSIFGAAAIISVPVVLSSPVAWLVTPAGLALVLWLGVVTTAIAYLLFGWGLERLAPTTVSTLTLAEPLVATLLGLLVLHEQLAAVSVVGLVVMAAGLGVLTLPSPQSRPSQ